jgi:hypothetical protein
MIRTLTPFFANALHAMRPAGPAPTMSTSTWLSDIDEEGGNVLWNRHKDLINPAILPINALNI